MSTAPPAQAEAPPAAPAAAAIRATTTPTREASDTEAAAAGEFGVDVGGAPRFDGLRALWHSTKGANPALFEGLHPIVAVRESKSRGVDLRLIAGPLASTEAATRLCAALMAARRHCQMTTFEGQPLTLSAPEPERRPTPARPRNPAPAPAAAGNAAPAPASNSVSAPPSSSASASASNAASASTVNSAPVSTSTTGRPQAGGRP